MLVSPRWLVGIDGCRGGWLTLAVPWDPGSAGGAGLDSGLAGLEARVVVDLAEALAPWLQAPGSLVAVDMPIGLPPSGARPCDRLARRQLGPGRGSSVFPSPIRPMLQAASHGEACGIGRAVDGRALSVQAWNLMPRIRELDGLLQARKPWWGRVRESHPELGFQLWAGHGLLASKRSAAGRLERLRLVSARWPGVFERATTQLSRGGWAPDDLLDACACLRTAERLALGQALVLGGDQDGTGLPMEICG